ncbi:hypothetical protein L873DRAFT_1823516 [Choiromyces venosus 120613-1]|uniref:Uncharacterized protein n=1 Tax=Choiromyces venosus 120613-1 TaxID=1336337 RepID=A0A3N4IT33_9PEZI|nr:hypothetical protein L873DRAFT_1823516 [Choiromyces venosus 120613-1]
MVITLVEKDTTEKVLRSGISLFGWQFKAQRYLCLTFSHHTTQCTSTIHCAICTKAHPTHLHSCGRSQCPTSSKACLHTTIKCNNCNEPHLATSKECTTYINAQQAAAERR